MVKKNADKKTNNDLKQTLHRRQKFKKFEPH